MKTEFWEFLFKETITSVISIRNYFLARLPSTAFMIYLSLLNHQKRENRTAPHFPPYIAAKSNSPCNQRFRRPFDPGFHLATRSESLFRCWSRSWGRRPAPRPSSTGRRPKPSSSWSRSWASLTSLWSWDRRRASPGASTMESGRCCCPLRRVFELLFAIVS